MYKKTPLASLVHSLAIIAYVSAVAAFMMNGSKVFGEADNVFGTVAILLLFCISAAVVGLLVLGRPAYLLFTGQRREGIVFMLYTIGWLAVELVCYIGIMLIIRNS
ncbi:MAG: hypothetical protein WCT27_03430 [Patescibacteria group bacterium]|jgi:hypothetical protein